MSNIEREFKKLIKIIAKFLVSKQRKNEPHFCPACGATLPKTNELLK